MQKSNEGKYQIYMNRPRRNTLPPHPHRLHNSYSVYCPVYVLIWMLFVRRSIYLKTEKKAWIGPKSTINQTGTNLNAGCVLSNWLEFWPIRKRCRLKLNHINFWRRWMFWSLKLNSENIRFTNITRTWMTHIMNMTAVLTNLAGKTYMYK